MINLNNFKIDSISLNEMLTIHGGCGTCEGGRTCSTMSITKSQGSDKENNTSDSVEHIEKGRNL